MLNTVDLEPLEQDLTGEYDPEAQLSGPLPSLIRIYLNDIGRIPLLSDSQKIILARRIYWGEAIKTYRAELLEQTGTTPSNAKVAAYLNRTHRDRIRTTRDGMRFIAREIDVLVRDGDRAKDRMVEANLRFVVSIAKNYLNRNVPLADLIQEGSIGLIRGATKFDPELGYKFSTYTAWWIRQAITRCINDTCRTIRQSIPYSERMSRIDRVKRELHHLLGYLPTETQLVDALVDAGVITDLTHYRKIIGQQRQVISYDRFGAGDDDGTGSMLERIPDESSGITIANDRLTQDLEAILATLTPQQNWVLRLRQGLNHSRISMTVAEITTALINEPELILNALELEPYDLELIDANRNAIASIETCALRAVRQYKDMLLTHR